MVIDVQRWFDSLDPHVANSIRSITRRDAGIIPAVYRFWPAVFFPPRHKVYGKPDEVIVWLETHAGRQGRDFMPIWDQSTTYLGTYRLIAIRDIDVAMACKLTFPTEIPSPEELLPWAEKNQKT